MTRLLLSILSVTCLLCPAPCQGFHLTNQLTDDCACVPWAEAYATGKGGPDCMKVGLGSWSGGEFCEYMQSMKSNVCFQQYMSAPKLVDQVCFVSSACTEKIITDDAFHSPEKYGKYKMKKCSEDRLPFEDTLIRDLSYKELKEDIMDANHVDPGITCLLNGMHIDKLMKDVSIEETTNHKASGIPVFIWGEEEHMADRMMIMNNQVWIQHWIGMDIPYDEVMKHPNNEKWTSTCVEGCNDAALLQKDAKVKDDDVKVKDDDGLFPFMTPAEMAASAGMTISGAALASNAMQIGAAASLAPGAGGLNDVVLKLYSR